MKPRLRICLPLLVLAALAAAGCNPKNSADEAAYRRAIRDIKSPNQAERATAAENLKRWPAHAKESIPLLIEALKDDYTWVPIWAAGSLTALTDKDFTAEDKQLNHERWHKWWYEEVKQKAPKVAPPDDQTLKKVRAKVENDKGQMYLGGGDYVTAANHFMEAIKIDGRVAMYHSNLGLAMLGLKQYDRALRFFDVAKSMDPNFTESYLNKGGVYTEMAADKRSAAAEYQASLNAKLAAGERDAAAEDKKRMTEAIDAAKALEKQAVDEFLHALATDRTAAKTPDRDDRLWAAHLAIGRIRMRQGNWEDAAPSLEKARDLQNRDLGIRRDLAITYFALDQFFRSWKEIKAIEELGGRVDAGFRKKVEDRVREMGGDPGRANP
ncbi:MAG TPA: tetratricopeptide repeat protein [Planctomycetota bacterium]|nr:tetratricopeptide repeat protein [Planctomycetota bacterium]